LSVVLGALYARRLHTMNEIVGLSWISPSASRCCCSEPRWWWAAARPPGLLVGSRPGRCRRPSRRRRRAPSRPRWPPAPRPYTLEWTGAIYADREGRFHFWLTSLGASAIWADGTHLAQKGVPEGIADGEIAPRKGWHDLRVRFTDSVDFAYVTGALAAARRRARADPGRPCCARGRPSS